MISMTNISRHFTVGDEEVRALHDVTLRIEHGEYVSIMGPSGSGKSTLLNILGLLDRPSAGSYEIDGKDVTGLNDHQQSQVRREKIGFVFQFFHLVPRLSAEENVELPLVLAGVAQEKRKPLVSRLLSEFGIAKRSRHRPDQLSGGERQRVAIARAMVMNPAAILADEPTGNLDSENSAIVLNMFQEMNYRFNQTIIMITHNPEAAAMCRRIVQMRDGQIVAPNTGLRV